jgi:hypothetical protein
MSRNTFFILFLPLLFSSTNLCSQTPISEDCTNGIDDDGDGLIDCFDPECGCTGPCTSHYYNTCPTSCFYHPPCDQVQLGIDWTGNAETGTYSVLVAGDLDRDGTPEVITYNVENNQIYIINGSTGQTKHTIICPSFLSGGTSPAIADLDNNGFGEIIIVADDRRLRCWDHLGNLQWTSPGLIGYDGTYRFSSPNIADFDHNGQAEINIGNQVFSGQTGALLASGSAMMSAGEHPARKAVGFSFNAPVAMDILPDSYCTNCQGLEIVAGNQVLSVNLATGQVNVEVSAPIAYSDGFTSIADIDLDGDLDAIVQGRKNGWNTVYAWELETATIIGEYRLINNWNDGASRVNIADLNDDSQLEMNFISFPYMYTLKSNFTLLWSKPNDDVSAVTSSSIFDFCGDGSADIVYRGQSALQILEGATGAIKWQDACISATHIENPLILDVDADGQTEVVITCGQNGQNNSGRVVSYETVNTPGIASRPVWNQHAYFNTNINDDLSVPRFQQNPHVVGNGIKLNGFLNQYFNPTFPAPDGSFDIRSTACVLDSILLEIEICNQGQNILPAVTPISFYTDNPTIAGSSWFFTAAIGQQLPFDSCVIIQITIPRVANQTIYGVLNDDHSQPTPYSFQQDFPVTSIGECNFMNNIDTLFLDYAPIALQLGSDTLICDNATLNLNAFDTYAINYLWQDGSTNPSYLADDLGIYMVQTTDICQIIQRDTVAIGIDSSTVVNLGNDLALCRGESFSLSQPGFDAYVWQPVSAVNCATCSTVVITPHTSANIILTASLNNGCWSSDTLFATVHDTTYQIIDTTICYGLEVTVNGMTIQPDTTVRFDLQSQYGCDSTVVYRVKGTLTGTYEQTIDTSVCLGTTINYNGVTMSAQSSQVIYLTATTGCDSTIRVFTHPLDTFFTTETLRICTGDTADIFGFAQSNAGLYSMRFLASNGCDSTHQVALTLAPPISVQFDADPTCPGASDGGLTCHISGGTPVYSIIWDDPNLSGTKLKELAEGIYQVTVTDQLNCTQTASAQVNAHPDIVWNASSVPTRCFGESNGVIHIGSSDSTYLYQFENQPFRQAGTINQLAAGVYQIVAQDINGCTDTRDVEVTQPDQLLAILNGSKTLLLGDSLVLEPTVSSSAQLQYTWSPAIYLSCMDCAAPIAKPLYSVKYSLTVTDENGCSATAQQMIDIDRTVYHYAANVFAPDAVLDVNAGFMPYFGQAVSKVTSFQVFDRWGSIQHECKNLSATDTAMTWRGRKNGKTVLPGVYIWSCQIELVDGTSQWLKGDIAVLR